MKLMHRASSSAPAMIRADHAKVLAQFHKLTPDTTPGVCAATARTICTALEIHAQLEEEIFYPALREAGVDSPVLDKSVPEHDEMRRMIQRVRGMHGQTQAQHEALCELMGAVMHHVADEESQLLPLAELRCSREQLQELGARMTARKLALARPHAGEIASSLVRGAPGKTALMAVGALALTAWLLGHRRQHHAPLHLQ